jgi:hypothetical protein
VSEPSSPAATKADAQAAGIQWRPALWKYALENPLKLLWSAVLIVGSVFLLVLFGHYQFMPDVDLQSSTAVVAAVALLGLVVLMFPGVFAVLPGLLMRALADEAGVEVTWRSILVALAPAVAFMVSIFGAALAEVKIAQAGWTVSIVLVMLLTSGAYAWHAVAVPPEPLPPRRHARTWRRLTVGGIMTLCSTGWLVGVFITAEFFFAFAQGSQLEILSGSLLAAAWLALCCLISVGIARLPMKEGWRFGLLVAPFLALLLMALLGRFSIIPEAAARGLGLGGERAVRLILTAQGCRTLNLANTGSCTPPANAEPAQVCPASLLLRVGSQVLVQTAAVSASGRWPDESTAVRVVLSKGDVLGWAPLAASAASAPSRSSGTVLSIHAARWLNAEERALLDSMCK